MGIADHYLAKIALSREETPPCLVTLTVTSLLLAAKVEEHTNHKKVDIHYMLKILKRQKGVDHITK